ncbi:unnamed protein product [Musa acuminata subsp. malaccensis]|uniref:RING-type E3 ubiquitin transferase n=1 Tax=Musa acuminata subsp. malaccensis TaxID=214687 RepID=A0A804J5M1_MUSAM|nr:unnamed protein product [Musa acuminata subsp. malaccensis]
MLLWLVYAFDIKLETKTTVVDGGEKTFNKEGTLVETASSKGFPCIDRLREELSCTICLEICFEPSTCPCGHRQVPTCFCIKCSKCAANKCGNRCPKCREPIS